MFKVVRLSKSRRVRTRKPARQAKQSQNVSISIVMENETKIQGLRDFFRVLHQRNWTRNNIKGKSYDILIPRIVSIVNWFFIIIIELLAYSSKTKSSSMIFNFLFGFSYHTKNILAVIYASGAAVYGISIEIYLIVPLVIINSILAITSCGINHGETRGSFSFMLTTIALFISTELAHQNFKRFTYQQSYKLHCQIATRAMLRPFLRKNCKNRSQVIMEAHTTIFR